MISQILNKVFKRFPLKVQSHKPSLKHFNPMNQVQDSQILTNPIIILLMETLIKQILKKGRA